jgi:hypothetical protein
MRFYKIIAGMRKTEISIRKSRPVMIDVIFIDEVIQDELFIISSVIRYFYKKREFRFMLLPQIFLAETL